jgi:hypothetical protein
MAEPVIARRCQKCGASIREAAFHCPQCGNQLAQRDSGEPSSPVTPEETVSDPATTLGDTLGDLVRETRKEGPVQSRKESRKKDGQKSQPETSVKAPAPGAARASMSKAARGAVGAKLQRATSMARDVEGDVMDRARKVREISSVVLDEAGDDPSLRFVLVAAVLFFLFLIIVVLNKLIG